MTENTTPVTLAYTTLPGRTSRTAVIQLGEAGSQQPVALGAEVLAGLQRAVEALEPGIEAVVLRGTEFSLSVGADLKQLGTVTSREEAAGLGTVGWEVFARLRGLGVPVIALITGFALGGGCELALFADWRIARSDVRGIGLPEVRLGLIPGWGGLYRLAHLLGPAEAFTVGVRESQRGIQLKADAALERGIVDRVVPLTEWSDGWAEAAAEFVARGPRPAASISHDDWQAAVDAASATLAKGRPSVSAAPAEALRLIALAETQDLAQAAAATSDAFGGLVVSPAAKASLYAHNITNRIGRVPKELPGTPKPVGKAAVIGAGLMASQLALLLVQYLQVPVVLIDLDEDRAKAGAESVRTRLRKVAESGGLRGDLDTVSQLVTGSAELADIRGADFVVEAIFENLEAKQDVFSRAEEFVADHAVLATNTSSLDVAAIASVLKHPERFVGFHVFNPVEVVPLVEIIRTPQASDDAIATAFALGARTRRAPIESADRRGFIVNRVLTRLYDEVFRAIDAGIDPLVVDTALDPIGLPMTPLRLLDYVGHAVQLHVSETMHQAYPDRFVVPQWLSRVVDAKLGRVLEKDGALTAPAAALLPPSESASSVPDAAREALRTRILSALADEITRMLDEQVVASAADIDAAVILGANWPRALGGITPYLVQQGLL